MRFYGSIITIFLTAAVAHATELWQWTHDASGSGMSNVMDGGPPVVRSVATEGLDDGRITFTAADRTRPGSQGASASAGGTSIVESFENFDGSFVMNITVDLLVGYFPSSFPGGDNPGGSASGEVHSLVEFVVPKDNAIWFYDFFIDNTHPELFDGSSSVLMENLTQSSVILDLTEETTSDGFIPFNAAAGDVIRLTVDGDGAGGMGPGTGRNYDMDLSLRFSVVPEPGAMVLLTLGWSMIRRPRRTPFIEGSTPRS